jgi:hypothetical protein
VLLIILLEEVREDILIILMVVVVLLREDHGLAVELDRMMENPLINLPWVRLVQVVEAVEEQILQDQVLLVTEKMAVVVLL